ncbi:RNase adapter RapZ [Paenisporosarcina cavernae]|uniref:RNase adapter RapZ n=1 Tax=Paenisporosarcina cavernae TaxID=2320858 RepID=A0A385YU86_9BACL|nr:RNase adapter RapZ [Paenisporosarcina cavernae]AYC30114.1 RNase adapter RapZ [Paenisporosarcina cavernae]
MDNSPSIDNQFVLITGMSGAGKTVAIQSFEDLGFFCIDNLPPALLMTFLKLMKESGKDMRKVAAVIDMRGGDMFDSLIGTLDSLSKELQITPKIVFLDADDQTLVRRYKESRRSHPLAPAGLPLDGIHKERQLLSELKGRANFIFQTSSLKPVQLREKIQQEFNSQESATFTVNILSFGFKHGLPIDADLVFDVRFLPNPYYIENLRPLTGMNEEVSGYVLKFEETKVLIEKLTDLLRYMIPLYKKEGKRQLVIAFGCTGGQHRSVTLAEYYGKLLGLDYDTVVTHRDIKLRKG